MFLGSVFLMVRKSSLYVTFERYLCGGDIYEVLGSFALVGRGPFRRIGMGGLLLQLNICFELWCWDQSSVSQVVVVGIGISHVSSQGNEFYIYLA